MKFLKDIACDFQIDIHNSHGVGNFVVRQLCHTNKKKTVYNIEGLNVKVFCYRALCWIMYSVLNLKKVVVL